FHVTGVQTCALPISRLREKSSILDAVLDKLTGLKMQVGAEDGRLLDGYAESIRDVELRIQKAEEQIDLELPEMTQPEGAPATFRSEERRAGEGRCGT